MSIGKLPGQVVSLRDAAAVAEDAARRLGDALRAAVVERGMASLALSGGNTPRPAYEQLALQPGVDWAKVSVFWIDERAVPPTHARSNFRLANESLLGRAPIPPGNVHRMLGDARDLAEAARAYEVVLSSKLGKASNVPVFDVAVLGIGDDGHTASLFPGEPSVLVRDRLVLAIAAAPELEREARLTVTAPVIEESRTVFVLAVGGAKRGPLARVAAAEGDLRETPSRLLLRAKGAVTWILDAAAAGAT